MKKRVYVESLGCDANRTDSRRVQAMCEAGGWTPTSDPREADVVVVMTCGFTRFQEEANIRRISQLQALKADGAELIVGGCLPGINAQALRSVHDGFTFGPRTLDRLRTRLPSPVGASSSIATVTPSAEEPGVCLVRVATGCLDKCSYCAIPFANGQIRSRTPDEIEAEVRKGFDEGYRVFHLVSEDIGAWGQDRSWTLLDLLDRLLALPLPVRFRLHNLNPNWLRDFLRPLLERLKSDRIVKRFYIPVQSGSDRVLERMRRRYTADQAREICAAFRSELPGAQYSADWIVGFPGETDEDFEQTRRLMIDLDFDFASIYKYEERPRIEAASLVGALTEDEKEERVKVLIADALALYAVRMGFDSEEDLVRALGESRTAPINTNVKIAWGEPLKEMLV